MKRITRKTALALLLTLMVFITACGNSSSNNGGVSSDGTIKIGVTPGPHAEIAENVAALAKKQGLNIEIVEFSDFATPNVALNDGQIFANAFQTQPYLTSTLENNPDFKIVKCFNYGFFPMALYSNKIKSLSDIKDGMTVAIPNDPANGARGILLLAANGLITVKDPNNLNTTVADITSNPKNLKIVELEAATMPKTLDDIDIGAINAPYAMSAGLNPSKDSLAEESKSSSSFKENICFLATRTENANDSRIAKLKEIYQSDENKQFILEHFQGAIIPAFD